ncbi:MAG TPA: hypothetical protein VN616_04820 [Puia sp.]|nr:hypothetical protein [Puia sp.]
MKIDTIFVPGDSEDGIWSIQLDGETKTEYERFFDLMEDIESLRDFFKRNVADLQSRFFGVVSFECAIKRTLSEANEIQDALIRYSEYGFRRSGANLQYLFRPLNNFEFAIVSHQKSKARLGHGWIRLYAIRIAENCFVMTGGAIKLSRNMNRPHLQRELNKLDITRRFLIDNGIHYPEDLNYYENH